MDPGEIEFTSVHPVGGPAEEDVLDLGRDPRRLPRGIQAAVVIGALVAGSIWLATRPSRSHPAALPSPNPSPPSSVVESAGPLTFVPVQSTEWVVKCPNHGPCNSSIAAQAAVLAAVRAHLPTAQLESGLTTIKLEHGSQTALAERVLKVTVGSAHLVVRIMPYLRPGATPSAAPTPTPSGLSSAFFHVETAAYVVDEEWTAGPTTSAPATQLEDLARDPRLEVLS